MAQHRAHARDVTDRLLAGLEPEARRAIVAVSHRRTLQPAQVLFQTGEPATRLFVLRKGRVQFGRLARTGREVVMGILVPGDVFGLASFVQRSDYIGTAKALEAGEALVWTDEAMRRLVRRYPQLTANALSVALQYVAVFATRHEQLVSGTAEHRLASALARLGTRGVPSPLGIQVLIKNEQLASLADVSPFTASRVLKRWERMGVVRKGRGTVDIVTPEKLVLD